MTDDDCVFCAILRHELTASRLYESETVLAFMDNDPVTVGHVLVVPKAHLPDLADLSDDLGSEMLTVARRVAAALRQSTLQCEGINLFYADGEAASQEVFHAHLHVFPRYKGDGSTIDARWGSNPTREELDDQAEQLRTALAAEDGNRRRRSV